MKLIKKEEVGCQVDGRHEFRFVAEQAGVYLIEIIASAKLH